MFAFWLLVSALACCFAWMLCQVAGFGSRAEEREEAEADLAKSLRPYLERRHGVENMTRDELLELAHH